MAKSGNNKLILIIAIVVGAAVAATAAAVSAGHDADSDAAREDVSKYPVPRSFELGDSVQIGAILPITGDLSTYGLESKVAAELAVEDFNAHLDESTDAEWRLDIVVEDTGSNPVNALEKLSALHAKNIKVVLGPLSSAEARNLLVYAEARVITLISPSSTATSLAMKDHLFRLMPDDTKQAAALATLFADRGIEIVIPIWRGDAWGDDLIENTRDSFTGMDGIMDEGIRYSPESPEFSASVSVLEEKVAEYSKRHDMDRIGILAISFAEVLPLMQSASEHEILDDVAWFGSDGNTQEQKLIDDPTALEFSQTVGFTTIRAAFGDNPTYEHVKQHIQDKLGRVPNAHAFSSYDAVWLAGLAYLELDRTNITGIHAIKPMLSKLSHEYNGAIGSTSLNDEGDLDVANYEIWTILDGQWVVSDGYITSTAEIVPAP